MPDIDVDAIYREFRGPAGEPPPPLRPRQKGRRIARIRQLFRHPRFLRWSIQNRVKGYKFGPVQRHRCCDHTTPSHYRWCRNA